MSTFEKKKNAISQHRDWFNYKFEHIKRLIAALAAQSLITLQPQLIDISKVPYGFEIKGLKFKPSEILGIDLSNSDRQARVNVLVIEARRLLIADSVDILIESICRAWNIHEDSTGRDPYSRIDELSYTGKMLFAGSKQATLFTDQEKAFLELIALPIRNAIRHNNGVIPPGRKLLQFKGEIQGSQIDVTLNRGTELKIHLWKAYWLFDLTRKMGNSAFNKLLEHYNPSH